jgi:hypothetical protein
MSGLEDEKKDEKKNTERMTDNRMVKLARDNHPTEEDQQEDQERGGVTTSK